MKLPSMAGIDFKAILGDFRNLNPKDIGTWPVAPRAAALLGLFLGILLAGWSFDWSDQLDTLSTRQQDEQKLKDEFVSVEHLAFAMFGESASAPISKVAAPMPATMVFQDSGQVPIECSRAIR